MTPNISTPPAAPAQPGAAVFYLTEVYNGPQQHAGFVAVRHRPGEKAGIEIGQGYGHWQVLTTIVRPVARPGDICITTPLGWPERGPRRVFDVVDTCGALQFVERLPAGVHPAEDETAVVEAETYRMWLAASIGNTSHVTALQEAR